MYWKDVPFAELTLDELYSLLKLRVDVFVVEQRCAYSELDDKDREPQTRHLLGLSDSGEILAYARILAPGVSYDEVSIGRVLVKEQARGQGLAAELMQRAIKIAAQHWPEENIQLGAQAHLTDFYASLGFVACSDVYLEDNIPHIDLLLDPKATADPH